MAKICVYLLMQLVILCVIVKGDDCDVTKCPSKPKHYEELACEPVKTEGDCCVRSYKCPDLKARNTTQCYYKNEVYKPFEQIKNEHLAGSCSASCFCGEEREGRPADFICAHIDCPEFFGGQYASKNCIRQYEQNKCCSSNLVCDDDIEKLAKCEFKGESYYEGQQIYPENSCYTCICTKNFNSTLSVEENKNCRRIDCGIMLRNSQRILNGCIPVYYKTDTCCPIDYKCPEEIHMKIDEHFKRRNATEPTCKFGNMEFNIGDSVKDEHECRECTCTVPPMMHCIQNC